MSFPGYDACAELMLDNLDIVLSQPDSPPDEAICLPLRPGFDGRAYRLDGEIPAGSRALIELVYFLTGAEIAGETKKRYGSLTYLHGIYEGTPIEFTEIHTQVDGADCMEWTVRVDMPAPEMEEEIAQRDLKATRGEMKALFDSTVDEIRILPSMTRKKWKELRRRQAEAITASS